MGCSNRCWLNNWCVTLVCLLGWYRKYIEAGAVKLILVYEDKNTIRW